MKFREVLSKIRSLSEEVEVILLGSNDFWPGVRSLIQSGLVNDFWSWPVASKEVLQMRVDKVIEKTIFKYIAEQRSEETQKIVSALDKVQSQATGFQRTSPEVDIFNLPSDATTEARLIEDLVDNLKDNHPKSDFVYIKNYRAKSQLLISRTSFCKETYYRGQSLPMSEEQLKEDSERSFTDVRALLAETFSAEEFQLQPISFAGQTFGFIMAINFSENMERYLQRASRYVSLSLRNLQLETAEPQKQETYYGNEVTKSSFFAELSKEVSRARRISQPVSLILTHFEYATDHEKQRKEVVELIQDHLRIYDFFSLIEGNRIAIVLPHCDYENAAIKAERMRRIVLNLGMKTQNTPLRLCFGVCEYPRLSPDSDSLLMDVERACEQVLASGNNKVCLFTAPAGFEPEFQI
ncbi:MAG: diguanylate cyclase [Bdellovibrionales bacterium]|nr:GGDEF domain-containing protein [Bdellovibrionales bacterium]NQZ20041.1 diguanylate cyclase [Bdellovibrionales bacterium]